MSRRDVFFCFVHFSFMRGRGWLSWLPASFSVVEFRRTANFLKNKSQTNFQINKLLFIYFPSTTPTHNRKGDEPSMPSFPRRGCRATGCPKMAEPGQQFCKEHTPIRIDYGHSKSANERGYTYKWQKASRAYLRAHPLCAECQRNGRYVTATVVDHITPHRGDSKLFWDESNWQPLCKNCHDYKTGTEDRWIRYEYNRQDGRG